MKRKTSKVILGMVILQGENFFNTENFIKDFTTHWGNTITEAHGDGSTSFSFAVEGETIAMAFMPLPIPLGDIEGTAQYAYNWQSVLKDTEKHKSHIIVSLLQSEQDSIKRFKIFTQVLSSLLRITDAIGVYKGSQSLLIPAEDYLSEAEMMGEEYLPLNLWIYFGLRTDDNGNSAYTYGLKEFGKAELEIIDSSHSLEDIRGFLFNIAHYVLEFDVNFKDGQTIGGSESEKMKITFSKGKFVDGKTFKVAY
jgi:hypothetical protein